jgi:hypothetical protein
MNDLIALIEAAFDMRPCPVDEDITRCTYDKKNGGAFDGPCWECVEMAAFFRGQSWRNLTGEDLRQEGQADSLFTVPAYCYFLPAFLIAAVREPEDADVCVDHLAYRFGPKSDDKWGQDRAVQVAAKLTAAERDATLAYFRFAVSRDGDFDGYIERAIDTLTAEPAAAADRASGSGSGES